MPLLRAGSGRLEGQVFLIDQDRIFIGRNPDCDIVVASPAVSRWHARISRLTDGYYIEDLNSRNGTLVNEKRIETATLLHDGDRISAGDFEAVFSSLSDTDDGSSTYQQAALPTSAELHLETQPAERLAALLAITAKLTKTLQLDTLLPDIADSLLELFRNADRCFLILTDDAGNLRPKVIKTRLPNDSDSLIFSRSIVQQCLEQAQALLLEDSAAGSMPATISVSEARIRSVMCVPLTTAQGKGFGVIQLDTLAPTRKFTEDDLRLLLSVAQQVAVSLENARFHEASLAQERVERDLQVARAVQLSFLPSQVPQAAGYDFFAHYQAALAVGGDYYDFIPMPGGRVALTVGDVAGKGISAALLMARFAADARTCLLTRRHPCAAFGCLNEMLCEQMRDSGRFVTFVLALLNPATHVVTLVGAGHPIPLVYRRASQRLLRALPTNGGGPPLGMTGGIEFTFRQIKLGPGDQLLLFSDGLLDAPDAGGTGFGPHGIEAAALAAPVTSAKELGERIVAGVRRHAAGTSPYDDVTLLCAGRSA